MNERRDTCVSDGPTEQMAHIVPLRVLLGVFAVLLMLTFVTVAATWFDGNVIFGGPVSRSFQLVESQMSQVFIDAIKLAACRTLVWNGPVGVFEFDQFGHGTKTLALAIAEGKGFSIAGGGDTLAAIDTLGIQDKFTFISTGGGAMLEFLAKGTLPGIEVLGD